MGEIDSYIGMLLQAKRIETGLEPEELACRLGVTVETVLAYEEGRTRIPASNLEVLCRLFGVKPAHWFEGALRS